MLDICTFYVIALCNKLVMKEVTSDMMATGELFPQLFLLSLNLYDNR